MFVKTAGILTQTKKLFEQVADRIRQDIAEGKFKPGQKIPTEPELMKLYEVGRSSVREAIKALSVSGVLTVQQGSGTFINEHVPQAGIEKRLQYAHFEDVNAVRSLLEKEIVRLATEKHQPGHIEEMETALALRKEAIHENDQKKCTEADIAFHTAIAKASMNPVLADLYYSFTLNIRNFFSAREEHGLTRFAMNHHLHEELAKAIKAGKTKQSQAVIQQILDNNY